MDQTVTKNNPGTKNTCMKGIRVKLLFDIIEVMVPILRFGQLRNSYTSRTLHLPAIISKDLATTSAKLVEP